MVTCIAGMNIGRLCTWSVDKVQEVGFAGGALHDQAHGHHLEADSALLLVQACVCEPHWPLIVPPFMPDLVRLLHKHVHDLQTSNQKTSNLTAEMHWPDVRSRNNPWLVKLVKLTAW